MEIYFKDSFVPADSKVLDIEDRSFRFGDGIFETALVSGGKIYDWPAHQKRMLHGVKYFRLDIDISKAEDIAAELIKRNKIQEGYIRVIISRGDAGRVVGYKAGNAKPYIVISGAERKLPGFTPIKLYLASQRLFYNFPCKTNNALIYTMAFMEAEDNGCDNALLLNHEGYVCETANANIFWLKGNVLYTPSTDLPLVIGTIRSRVLELWAGKIEEGKFKPEEFQGADEIFTSNVGSIITPVIEIKPLGLKPAKQSVALTLREKLVQEIMRL